MTTKTAKIRKTVTNQMVVEALANKDNRAIIKSVLRGFANQLDEQTLESCANVAMFRVLRYHEEDYPGGVSFKVALWRMTKNICINEVHALDAFRRHKDLAKSREREIILRHDSDIDKASEKVNYLLENMPDHLRHILHLYYFEDHSYPEISKLLNLSVEQCRKQVQLALEFAKFITESEESVSN